MLLLKLLNAKVIVWIVVAVAGTGGALLIELSSIADGLHKAGVEQQVRQQQVEQYKQRSVYVPQGDKIKRWRLK